MANRYFELAFTDPVRAWQQQRGARASYQRAADHGTPSFSRREIDCIEARDTFFLASVSATGWPYVQHRGGPAGFVRHIRGDETGWAEFAGNRQYVSSGNAESDSRIAMILIDFAGATRLKLLGRFRLFEPTDRPDLAVRLAVDDAFIQVERFAVLEVAEFDWNCPQHIVRRCTVPEMDLARLARASWAAE